MIELLVVITVIGVLAVALGLSFQGWQGKYRVEATVKGIYSDMMDARQMALNRNLIYFVDFNQPAPPPQMGSYRVVEDSNNNNVLYAAAPAIAAGNTVLPTYPKVVDYAITWAGGAITIDKKGIVQPAVDSDVDPLTDEVLCIVTVSDVDPDLDCLLVSQTRINLGKLTTWGGACDELNCVAR